MFTSISTSILSGPQTGLALTLCQATVLFMSPNCDLDNFIHHDFLFSIPPSPLPLLHHSFTSPHTLPPHLITAPAALTNHKILAIPGIRRLAWRVNHRCAEAFFAGGVDFFLFLKSRRRAAEDFKIHDSSCLPRPRELNNYLAWM